MINWCSAKRASKWCPNRMQLHQQSPALPWCSARSAPNRIRSPIMGGSRMAKDTDQTPVERALSPGHFFCPMQLTFLSPELRDADGD